MELPREICIITIDLPAEDRTERIFAKMLYVLPYSPLPPLGSIPSRSFATVKNVNVPRLAFPLDGEQPVFRKRILKWPPRVEARSVMTTKVVDETEIAVASTIAPCLELHPKCASFRSGLQIVVTN